MKICKLIIKKCRIKKRDENDNIIIDKSKFFNYKINTNNNKYKFKVDKNINDNKIQINTLNTINNNLYDSNNRNDVDNDKDNYYIKKK